MPSWYHENADGIIIDLLRQIDRSNRHRTQRQRGGIAQTIDMLLLLLGLRNQSTAVRWRPLHGVLP